MIIAYVRLISSIAIVYCFNQSNFLMQISCGTKTKRRKTRAKPKDFAILVSIALKQLRHFFGSGHSFAKIAIHYTI